MQKPSKSDTLYARMRSDILTLALAPGSVLRLPAISERYGIGVTPVRECLNRLSIEKLVEIEHNKGFRVADLSLDELLDLERSRATVEGALFVEAIKNGDDAWEAQIIGAYHQLSQCKPMSVLRTPDELDMWNRRHAAFHDALIAAAGATWLQHFRGQISDQLGRYQLFIQNSLRELHKTQPEVAPQAAEAYSAAMAIEPHEELYEVVLSRNVASARTIFEDHVGLSIQAFEDLMALIPADTIVAKTLGTHREAHP